MKTLKKTLPPALLAGLMLPAVLQAADRPYAWTNFVGLPGTSGSADGMGSAARFNNLTGVATDTNGNLYVVDYGNHIIRKVTVAGTVTTLAGSAGNPGNVDDTGNAARFNGPLGVAVDNVGNVFVADSANYAIRKVTAAGVVTTLAGGVWGAGSADGTGGAARFDFPASVAVDNAGNVFVADTYNSTIRKVTAAGVVTTLAGSAGAYGGNDGTGSDARFFYPRGVAVNSAGNVFVAEYGNSTIRKVTPEGVVTTIAGSAGIYGSADGIGSSARFYYPVGLAVDSTGDLFVAEYGNSTIRKVRITGEVTTIGGVAEVTGWEDGVGFAARFANPSGIAADSVGNLYIADSSNHRMSRGIALYAPPITQQPLDQTIPSGNSATFSVTATGQSLYYQWRFGGTDIADATSSSFTLSATALTNIGYYDVVVYDSLGTNISDAARLAFLDMKFVAALFLNGPIGSDYRIEYRTTLDPTNWVAVTNITLPTQPYIYVDYDTPTVPQRFYRAVPLP